ncbi:hypothetical protein WG907_09035 [Sphingobium sp. AN558]|uniref:hypothetical protein n=1 Tax=Sphingobium sp. AN558 TaxID=3133442 RepID=UPI0030BC7D86
MTTVPTSGDGDSAVARSPPSRRLVAAVVALFFIWGGLTSLNDILIPKLKGLSSLSYAEAMLAQFAFFMAYFLISVPAGALIARVGYMKGIVIGLSTMAAGCLMFVPAERMAFLAREAAVIGHAYIVIAAILICVALFFLIRRAAIAGGQGHR